MNFIIWAVLVLPNLLVKLRAANSQVDPEPEKLSSHYQNDIPLPETHEQKVIIFLNSLIWMISFTWHQFYIASAPVKHITDETLITVIFKIQPRLVFKCFSEMGLFKAIQLFLLCTKLFLKHCLISNKIMRILRWYCIYRCVETVIEGYFLNYDETLWNLVLLGFCRDYLCVFGSVGIIAFLTSRINEIIGISKRSAWTSHLAALVQGTVTATFLILNILNISTALSTTQRVFNMNVVFKFTIYTYFLMICSFAWLKEGYSARYFSVITHIRNSYIYMAAVGLLGILMSDIVDEFSDDIEDLPSILGIQVVTIAFYGIITCLTCSILIYLYPVPLSVECRENIFQLNMFFNYIMELGIACGICHQVYINSNSDLSTVTPQYIMAALNLYNTVVNKGFYFVLSEFFKWGEIRFLLNQMEFTAKTKEKLICNLCSGEFCIKDDVLDLPRKSTCGHTYHYFCIREWMRFYPDTDPECDKALVETETYHRQPVTKLSKLFGFLSKLENEYSFFSEAENSTKKSRTCSFEGKSVPKKVETFVKAYTKDLTEKQVKLKKLCEIKTKRGIISTCKESEVQRQQWLDFERNKEIYH